MNTLPVEVAREQKEKGHHDAKHLDKATILITDFKGFTEVSEKLSPQELVEEINSCFQAFDQITTARGIERITALVMRTCVRADHRIRCPQHPLRSFTRRWRCKPS